MSEFAPESAIERPAMGGRMASMPEVEPQERVARDPALFGAVAVSFILFSAVYANLGGVLRVVLGLASVWALGYAVLAAIYPRGADLAFLERQAVGVAIGIIGFPVLGLLVGVVWGFWAVSIAFSLFLTTTAAGIVAVLRSMRAVGRERVAWSPLPGPRLTLGAGGVILIGAALFAAVSAMQSHDEGVSVAFFTPAGEIPSFPATVVEGELYELVVMINAPSGAHLLASVTSPDGGIHDVFDAPVDEARVPLVIGGLQQGAHHLEVTLEGDGWTRHLGAWLVVIAGTMEVVA